MNPYTSDGQPANVTCPHCHHTGVPSYIDTRWRGLIPWHKGVDTPRLCPGTEQWAPVNNRPGQAALPFTGG